MHPIITLLTMSIFAGLFWRKKEDAKPTYLFLDSENTACFTCRHIIEEGKPILYVGHDDDGAWQFMCGAEAHETEDAKIVGLLEIVKIDPSVNVLHEMPLGVCSKRQTPTGEWKAYKI